MNLLDVFTSTATGGLFGGLLALGNTWLTAKIRKDDRAHELDVLRLQSALKVTGEEWAAFRASQESAGSDNSGPVWPWAASVRTLTRPVLTFALTVASVAVYFTVPAELKGDIGRDLLMLNGTAIGWWFGSRPALLSSRR